MRKLLVLAGVAAVWLAGAAGAAAQPRNDSCYRELRKEEEKWERDVRKHGYSSRQAQHRREKIASIRARCEARFFRDRYRYDAWRDRDRDGRRDRDDRWRDNNWRDRDWPNGYPFDLRWVDHYRDRRWRDRDGRNLDWFFRNGYIWRDNRWCRR